MKRMSEKITITKEMLIEAKDYIPLMAKEAWVAENAIKCFDKLAITAGGEAVPPMYMVNTGMKSRLLMGAFIKLYFGLAFEADADDSELMTVEDYDNWAGSHVFNQIERFKSDKDMRDKCYDLLIDYRDFEKRFSAQINGILTVQNDSVMRQNEYMSTQMKELPKVFGELKELQRKVEENGESTAAE